MLPEKLSKLFTAQDQLNTIINPNWKEERTIDEFVTEVLVESVELIDHLDHPWWKINPTNIKQAQMECIDIWFFLVSAMILDSRNLEKYKTKLEHETKTLERKKEVSDADIIKNTKEFIHVVSTPDKPLSEQTLGYLCDITFSLGITYDMLYDLYMAKLVLNIFRQKNGYGSGSYTKIWNGKEDNIVLRELMEKDSDPEVLEQMLSDVYNSIDKER